MRRFSFLRLSQAPEHQVGEDRFSVTKLLLQPPQWLSLALRLRGSVIPAILSEVLFRRVWSAGHRGRSVPHQCPLACARQSYPFNCAGLALGLSH